MVIHYDEHKLSRALTDFYQATGVNISIADADFKQLCEIQNAHNPYCAYVQNTAEGRCACRCSDESLFRKCQKSHQTEMHICHAGLLDIATPVIHKGTIIAYVIMGQLKVAQDFNSLEVSAALSSTKRAASIYDSIPYITESRILAVANLAVMLTKYILLENILTPTIAENLGKAEAFITSNLQKELSVQDIAKGANVSKSVLYKDFHICFNCTVKEYINAKRIEKAVELITTTNLSMDEISQQVGFSSASYFSKIFKAQKGISPLKYRKINN